MAQAVVAGLAEWFEQMKKQTRDCMATIDKVAAALPPAPSWMRLPPVEEQHAVAAACSLAAAAPFGGSSMAVIDRIAASLPPGPSWMRLPSVEEQHAAAAACRLADAAPLFSAPFFAPAQAAPPAPPRSLLGLPLS